MRRDLPRKKAALGLVSAALATVALALPASAAAVQPFGVLDCVPQSGVQFCAGSTAKAVPTWDGVPLDVNLTLPANRQSNLPLVVSLHGWGGSKSGISEGAAWASRGYAFLSYSARGFGQSCGSAASRAANPAGCAEGWIHLGDSRFEVRDTQYLAGKLVDQGIVNPRKIGVTGVSYGGGQSVQLAMLRNKTRLENGSLIPWRSPQKGKPMSITAAAPIIPWSDLVSSLEPNGRFLDYTVPKATDSYEPIGVPKQSYLSLLYGAGLALGYYAPPGVDPGADLTTWFSTIQAGEPYDEGVARGIAQEISNYHSGAYLTNGKNAARTLIVNGTTDDLFPVSEGLRFANILPKGRVSQLYLDYGHPRGGTSPSNNSLVASRVADWFDKYLLNKSGAKPLKGVQMVPQTCPATPAALSLFASNWKKMHPGEVRHSSSATQTIASGVDALGAFVDPVGGSACANPPAADQVGVASYRLPSVTGGGFTLAGSPTVVANLDVTGADPKYTELAARLWDVGTDGNQRLVARGVYRPSSDGQAVFQLHANAWKFAAGHVPKLELLGRDANYARPSNLPFTIDVHSVDLRLPVHEKPGGGPGVAKPAKPVLPAGATLVK